MLADERWPITRGSQAITSARSAMQHSYVQMLVCSCSSCHRVHVVSFLFPQALGTVAGVVCNAVLDHPAHGRQRHLQIPVLWGFEVSVWVDQAFSRDIQRLPGA